MGIVFRQSVKTTMVTMTGAVLGAVIVYLNTHLISPTEYGLVNIIVYLGAIGQMFVLMGTANLVAIYTQRYEYEDERRKALLTIGVLVTVAATIIFSLIFLLLKEYVVEAYKPDDRPLLSKYYLLVPVMVGIWGLVTTFEHYLIAHVKIAVSAFSREVLLRLCNIILLALIFAGTLNFHQYIIGNVLIYLVPLTILIFAASRTRGFGFTSNLRVFSKEEYKGMVHFSWYHLLTGASVVVLNYFDTLLIGPLDKQGIESTAPYVVSVYIAAVMQMPYRAMANSSLPILNAAYIEKDMGKLRDLFSRAGVNILIAGVAMFLLIGLNLHNAVAILPPKYQAVQWLVWILMIGRLFDMATGLNYELISISRYYKFNFLIAIFLLAMVYVLDRVFIPMYGIRGAAWVATGSLIVFNLLKMSFLYYKMKILPFTNKTWLVFVAGVVAGIAGYIFPYIYNPIADAITRSIVIITVYILMLLWLRPSVDLVSYLDTLKKNKRLF